MPEALSQPVERPAREALAALFLRFLRYGAVAWGGPVAQIARLKLELVERERWVTPERFNRALAVYQVLPGPEATEMCVWLGTLARGRLGGVAAGVAFVLPGLVLMLAASWAYGTLGWHGAWVVGAMAGLKPAVAALVLRAVHRLGRHAVRTRWLGAIAAGAALAAAAGLHFTVPLASGAVAHALATRRWRWPAALVIATVAVASALAIRPSDGPRPVAPGAASASGLTSGPPGEAALFGSGLKAGLLTFGGAYTAIPFVREDAVLGGRWITEEQFLDTLAIGSVLPAPLVIFITGVGYLAGGLTGALVMTAGVFLPAFAFTLIGHRFFESLVERPAVHAALDGVAAAVIGLIAVTAVQVMIAAAPGPVHAAVLVGALILLYSWRSGWATPVAIAGGGVLGGLLLRG